MFCEFKTIFRLKIVEISRAAPRFLKTLPIEIFFSKNFKKMVETLLIAHSMGKFLMKTIKHGTFLIKGIYEEIWCYFLFYLYMTSQNQDITKCVSPIIFYLRNFFWWTSPEVFGCQMNLEWWIHSMTWFMWELITGNSLLGMF